MSVLMMDHAAPSSGCKKVISNLLARIENILLHDRDFMQHVFDPSELADFPISPKEILVLLADEAERAFFMIAPHLRPGMRILEIGGGVGLMYALLRSHGFDIVSLEPGSDGFGDRHRAGLRVLQLLGIDPGGWLRTGIEDFHLPDRPIDLLFSFFVLEHVTDLDRAFQTMAGVLSRNGLMVHRCPNYAIPYEPHYNIPLIPFKPGWTPLIFSGLRHKQLWRGLNFTTVGRIRRLCARYGFRPVFRKGMTAAAFERVLNDPVFRSRKQGFAKAAGLLKASGMLKLLGRLPSALDTPMEFTAKKV
jgi:SAM-dependent methyltransferase